MVPAPLREVIFSKYSNTKLYITNAVVDKCLHIYPFEEWSRLEEKIRQLPKMNEAVKLYMRRVVASAMECDIDKQGRILVPYEQRQDAGIVADVAVVGQIDKIEIWDKAQWDAVTDLQKFDVKAIEAELAGFGL